MNRFAVTATLMMGTLMSSLDSSIVNVTLPTMKGSLGASTSQITWVSTGYMLANVVMMPLVAFLGGRFGRKNLYLLNVFIFTLSSALCGMAWNIQSMVAFRILQGAAGGLLIPISQSIIREIYTKAEQGMAMGIFGMGVILGPTVGPTLGGWITDRLSWQWVFYINLPIGAGVILMGLRYLSDPSWIRQPDRRIDLPGIVFMASGLGALQLMLEKGQEKGWFDSSYIVALACVAAIGIGLFVWRELSVAEPILDLRILKNRELVVGTLMGALQGFGLFGSLYLLPQFFQNILGYTAEQSGWAMSPRGVAIACTMPLVGRLYNRVDARVLMGTGLLLCSGAFYAVSHLSPDSSGASLFWPQILQGIGLGATFVTLSTLSFSTLDVRQMPTAAGISNVIRQVAGSVSIALFATQLERGTSRAHAVISAHVTPLSDQAVAWLDTMTRYFVGRGMDSARASQAALDLLNRTAIQNATLISFNGIFFMVALLFVLAAPLVLLIRKRRPGAPQAPE